MFTEYDILPSVGHSACRIALLLAGVLSGVFCSLSWWVVARVKNVVLIGTFCDLGAHFVSISSPSKFVVNLSFRCNL